MPEKKRAPYQSGKGKGNVSQIQGHLCDKTADELLTELEARMDEMTDLTYDEDVVDAYLAALDKKAPLEEDFDAEQSWEKFRSQHAILFTEDASPKSEVAPRKYYKFRFRKNFARVIVVAAIVAVFSVFCAQAAGFDVLGAIGRWTEETFRFSIPSSSSPHAVQIDNLFTEPREYISLQDAFNAYSITEPLAPTWIPEGYTLDYVEAVPSSSQILFTASYSNAQNTLSLSYSYRTDNTFQSSTFEKDSSSVITYTKNGIVHYIMSNVDVQVVAWVNGTCECSILGPLSEEEMMTMIDSIYLSEG
ncbi:MAG: DUF4367 domain-containing protein [Clostridiales bacterium]|nr:DUF4367 domain-containing protein [Clostridiales bacterium]